MLDSAMTRTFGNRQRGITTVGTYLSVLPLAKSKLTTKKVLNPGFKISILKSAITALHNSKHTYSPCAKFQHQKRAKMTNATCCSSHKTRGLKRWFWATNSKHPMHWGALGALSQRLFNNWPFLLSRSTHADHKYK